MVRDLVDQRMMHRAKIADRSEASFIEKYLLAIIQRVFLKDANDDDDLVYALIDKTGYGNDKPDIMIGTKIKRKEFYFFFVEVKRPGAGSQYQAEDDYTKLLKQMKDSVDDQLCSGVPNPT
ncbi:hypothetical protein ABG067_008834, partial [Albugo candida]